MKKISVGSVCSGIEAASVAWNPLGFEFKWFSEIASFPSKILTEKHPGIPNIGDMNELPNHLENGRIETPDLICGGTPCQAFSLAGWKKGLEDNRGNLTLKFVEVIEANDEMRNNLGLAPCTLFWENVEGVLTDKTNAFGSFLASLAGFEKEIVVSRWPQAGIVHGPKRNIAWRVLDAKYFGLPQQRRRLYVLGGGKDFLPEKILFEFGADTNSSATTEHPLSFSKEGQSIELFRRYTDCLYSAYGTKWNGNAAATNGSLFISQNDRLRRLTPLECERLMGFPDLYTDIPGASSTARYQALGNSWAVPVVRWLGERILKYHTEYFNIGENILSLSNRQIYSDGKNNVFDLSSGFAVLDSGNIINCSVNPINSKLGNLFDIIDVGADEKFYLTPTGCAGILRRKEERGLSINKRLEVILQKISSTWTDEKIENMSRKQTRGRFSTPNLVIEKNTTYSLFSDEIL